MTSLPSTNGSAVQTRVYESLNRELAVFKKYGIYPYTKCCNSCTYAFDDVEGGWDDFERRDDEGITMFGLRILDDVVHDDVYIYYDEFPYLMDHWEEEVQLIQKWCKICGVTATSIKKPENGRNAIVVKFTPSFRVTKPVEKEQSEEEDSDLESEGSNSNAGYSCGSLGSDSPLCDS